MYILSLRNINLNEIFKMKNILHPKAVKTVKTIYDLIIKEFNAIDKDNVLVWSEALSHPQLIKLRDKFDHLDPHLLTEFFNDRKYIRANSLTAKIYKNYFTYTFSVDEKYPCYRSMDAVLKWMGVEFGRIVNMDITPGVYFSNAKETSFTMIYKPSKESNLNPYHFNLGLTTCLKMIDFLLNDYMVAKIAYFKNQFIEDGPHVDDLSLIKSMPTAQRKVIDTTVYNLLDKTIRIDCTDESDVFWLFNEDEKLKFCVNLSLSKIHISMLCDYGMSDTLANIFKFNKPFELMAYMFIYSNIYYDISLRENYKHKYSPIYRFEIKSDRLDETIDDQLGVLFINEMYYVYIVEKLILNTYFTMANIDWDDLDKKYLKTFKDNFCLNVSDL